MLKLEDIQFPITFTTSAGNVTYSSAKKAKWAEGFECSLDLAYCVLKANTGEYQYSMAPAEKEPVQVYYRCIHPSGFSQRFHSLAEAQAHATERVSWFPKSGSITIVREVAIVTAEVVQSFKAKVEYL